MNNHLRYELQDSYNSGKFGNLREFIKTNKLKPCSYAVRGNREILKLSN